MKRHIPTLSFQVIRIEKRWCDGLAVTDTILRCYTSHELLTIRGEPWPIGAKVDFRQIKMWPT